MYLIDPCFLQLSKGIVCVYATQDDVRGRRTCKLIGPTTIRGMLRYMSPIVFTAKGAFDVDGTKLKKDDFLVWFKEQAEGAPTVEEALRDREKEYLVVDTYYRGNHKKDLIHTTEELDQWMDKYETGRQAVESIPGWRVYFNFGMENSKPKEFILKRGSQYMSGYTEGKVMWSEDRSRALMITEEEADRLIATYNACCDAVKVRAYRQANPYNVGITREWCGDRIYLKGNRNGHISFTSSEAYARRYANERTARKAIERLPEQERSEWSLCTFEDNE